MTGAQKHIPVLLPEVLAALEPKDGETHIDATFGAGGYSEAILETADCKVIAFDRDPNAAIQGQIFSDRYGDRFVFVARPFSEIKEALSALDVDDIDGAVFDLGVSSMQLDEAARGFSFSKDGALSMRMDDGRPNAADVVAGAEFETLKKIFRVFGEEKNAHTIAKAIENARKTEKIESTLALARIVEAASPNKVSRIHPATRVFQALRIFINDELQQLAEGLHASEDCMREGGRLVVVTFHSLEDRIAKRFFSIRSRSRRPVSRFAPPAPGEIPTFNPSRLNAIAPTDSEVAANPRSRSAKLRSAVRRKGARAATDFAELGVPTYNFSQYLKGSA
ncbi:MAG: 16S rRNA (cytosine(1402)-N(4))-methyltransferase RsmH [Pseudomonadota bacterium]